MKAWISGEVDAQTGDAFQRAMMRVETLLNEALESQNYDLPLESWDCIAIIRDDEAFREITRYSKFAFGNSGMNLGWRGGAVSSSSFMIAAPQGSCRLKVGS